MHRTVWIFFALASLVNAGSHLDFSYGVLEALRDHEDKATEYYEKAYQQDLSSLHLVRMMSKRLAQDGHRPAAIATWKNVLAARAENPSIWIEFGDFLGDIGAGDTLAEKKQLEAYVTAQTLAPGTYAPVQRLIVLARNQGDDTRARELLETLRADDPEAINYYVATTKSLYDSRDQYAAKRIDATYRNALAAQPESTAIARAASDHFRNTSRLEDAIGILRAHTTAAPTSLDLKIRLGILLFSSGKDKEALSTLQAVLAIHPRKALAIESLAKYYRKQGMESDARTYTSALLKLRGGTTTDFTTLADEFLAADDPRSARLLLEKATFDHPEDTALLRKLAIATSRDPETKDNAARIFREADAISTAGDPTDPAFLLADANDLIARGETKAAEEKLRDAIRNFPKTAKKETAAALRALACIWIKDGKNLLAAKALISRAEGMER